MQNKNVLIIDDEDKERHVICLFLGAVKEIDICCRSSNAYGNKSGVIVAYILWILLNVAIRDMFNEHKHA